MTFADLVKQFASKKLAALAVFVWFLSTVHDASTAATGDHLEFLAKLVKYAALGFVGYCIAQAIEGHACRKDKDDAA